MIAGVNVSTVQLFPVLSHPGHPLSRPRTSVSSVFMVLCKCLKNYTYFTLPCRGLGLVGLALYLVA